MTLVNSFVSKKPVSVRRILQVSLAMFLVLVTVIGVLPMQVLASTAGTTIDTISETSESLVGEVTQISFLEQGKVLLQSNINGSEMAFYIPDEYAGIVPSAAVGDTFTATARPGGMLPFYVGIGGTLSSAMEPDNLVTTGMYYIEVNGEQIHVFCVDASYPGPAQSGSYEVTLVGDSSFTNQRGYAITVSQLEALLSRGYPARTPAELGVANSEQAYYATRMAIGLINEWPNAALWHANPNVAGSQAVLDAIFAIANPSPLSAAQMGRSIVPYAALQEFSTFISPSGEEGNLTEAQAREGFLTHQNILASLETGITPLSSEMSMTPPAQSLPLGVWTSEIYTVTNAGSNFTVKWGAGTPTGAQILAANSDTVLATFPTNLENHTGNQAFRIRIPTQNTPGSLSFDVVTSSGLIPMGFLVPTAPNLQTVIPFILPFERNATGVLDWIVPIEDLGRLRIIKTDMEGNNLGGAQFTITGPGWPNGHTVTVPTGGWTSSDISLGEYTITEIQPPSGFILASNPTQTVMVTQGNTATAPAVVTFANERRPDEETPDPRTAPPPPVRIQKIDALSRENIPGALMRIEGRSNFSMVTGDGQIWQINNTGIDMGIVLTAGHTLPVVPEQEHDDDGEPIGPPPVWFELEDGVLTIHNLPWGYYRVQEERAPDGYSLLPQHTAYSFWVLPPNILVDVAEGDNGNGGGEGAEDGGIDAMFAAILNDDLGGPAYDLPPTADGESGGGGVEFIIDEEANVNSILVTFENYPFSEIVVYKRAINNGIEGDFLEGAMFRIEGFFVEGNAPQIIDMVGTTDSSGRLVFGGLPAGNYTITELQAPAGFMLNAPYHRSVNVSWGQIDGHPTRPAPSVVFFNTPKSSLEIHKVCATTGANLSGAVFEITDPTTGERWEATTGTDGRAIFGQGSLGNFLYPDQTYIVREIVAPQGFVLNSAPREVVLSPGDNNIITWTNYHNPNLTIIKRDAADHRLLAGAVFEVAFENGQTIAGSPFTTDSQGRIVIPEILGDNEFERTVIVTEITPPPGYNLANSNWQRVVIRAGEDNVITFDNERMPTLTIQKIDARTGHPIRGAWFEIEYLGATAGTGGGNIGPSGMLTGNPFVTDSNGRIVIEGVYSGRYRIREIRAADNYWLTPLEANRTWVIEVRDNEDYTLVVENTLLPTLVITKRNALTWRPIPMTQFRVEFEVPNSPSVQHFGYFMTNMQGQIILPFVQSGWYRVTETRPAPGMTLATNNNFRIFLQPGDNSYALIREGVIASESMIVPMAGDTGTGNDNGADNGDNEGNNSNSPYPPTSPSDSDEPVFEPDENDEEREYLPSGGNNGNVQNAPTPDIPTDAEVEAIEPDMDAIVDGELAPEIGDPANNLYTNFPDDFFERIDLESIEVVHYDNPPLIARMSDNMQVWGGDQFWNNDLGVWNFPQNSLIIRKENAVTGELLQGATFSVTQISSGNDSGLAGTVIGHFTTNHSGIIVISGLDPGYFLIEETIPPDNFTLSANNRQHAFLRPDGTSIVEVTFSNLPFSSMIITLRCSVTGAPIPNGEFRVTNSGGAVVGTDNGHFWTNLQGEILIPNVVPDSYVITQVTVPPLFVIDLVQSTQTIRVNPTGQIYRVDFFSDPLSQLLITLRCEVTGQPIQGGEFRVTNSAGNVVGSSNGIFFTNLQGEILIPNLGVDSYVVTQLNAPDGFRLGTGGATNSQTIFIQRPAETYGLRNTLNCGSCCLQRNMTWQKAVF